MKRFLGLVLAIFIATAALVFVPHSPLPWSHARRLFSLTAHADMPCPADNTGLKLPGGFCATTFADGIGHARHMVVAPNGVLYVNTWSGVYYGNTTPHAGGFLVALQDKSGAGKADVIERFGDTPQAGGAGGVGIALYNNSIYAEINDKIQRYALAAGSIAPKGAGVTVLSGMPITGDHPMHPILIDAQGQMYVDVATPSNACQVKNRIAGSPGVDPCAELATRGGIWLYDANKTDQVFSPAERFAT
jgi:glucose/arabinose dehydrogenase